LAESARKGGGQIAQLNDCVAEARKLSVSWYCRHDSILLQAPPIAIQRSVKETG
jgi:hypothetical protein